jgi:gliding motility-associated-like protein
MMCRAMLTTFSRKVNCKYLCSVLCTVVSTMLFGYTCRAQSLGDPIVKITFGSGFFQYAGALRPDSGSTTYRYVGASPDDNEYTIANSTQGMNAGWNLTTDHTGDGNGYMMVVNAAYTPGLFYTRTVTGLCGSTRYQFSAWIKNILKGNGILPNVTFMIEDVNGNYLGGGETSNISADNTWREYPFIFDLPANTQTVVLKMINNAPGGSGNDIAIDDIAFRAYGSKVNVIFDQANTTFCEAISQNITMRAATSLPPSYALKFQKLTSTGWEDLRPADTNPSIVIATPTLPGSYNYRMVTSDAGNINSPACVISSNYLAITVLPLPVASIDVADNACEGESTVFKDLSTAQGAFITSWLWDFGDGQTSTEKNPAHIYTSHGDFPVKLTVTNAIGCSSVTVTRPRPIHIVEKAIPDFRFSTPDCETQSITFTDISISNEGNIISRVWDFGDSTETEDQTTIPFQHTFKQAGNYDVKLTITTDKGCEVAKTTRIIVRPLPDVNFILPEVCYADQFARFVDSTFIADNSGLTYLWNFGDADATPGNPNTSTQRNPQHHYSQTKQYTISLTVTSVNGCTVTKTKTLQVNGSPLPDFEVLNENGLCATQEVFFRNKSTATVGNVTKIILYFDTNDRTKKVEDNEPRPGKLYRYLYPNAAQNYNVEMVAFTGDAGVCQEVKTGRVNIVASPVITFTPPDIICLNAGPIALTSTESAGQAGTAVYSGPGVTGAVFNPEVAGIGTWLINCIYTVGNASACADTVTRSITVKPIPTQVSAGPDVSMLSGNSVKLQAMAMGSNLKYSWSPIIGLDNSAILNPVVTLSDNSITYTLTVTLADSSAGPACFVTDSVKVTVLKVPEMPNVFTPNGDGINDTWEIKNLAPYYGAVINIFNRNGQKVYSSIGYSTPWDGRMNGVNLPIGVYYYIIEPKQGRSQVTGYVSIIR